MTKQTTATLSCKTQRNCDSHGSMCWALKRPVQCAEQFLKLKTAFRYSFARSTHRILRDSSSSKIKMCVSLQRRAFKIWKCTTSQRRAQQLAADKNHHFTAFLDVRRARWKGYSRQFWTSNSHILRLGLLRQRKNSRFPTVFYVRRARSHERVASRRGPPKPTPPHKGRNYGRGAACSKSSLSQQSAAFSAAFLSSLSQQLFSTAFLSNLSQQPFSAAFLSSQQPSQQPSSAAFLSSFSQQPFSATFLSSLSQQPFSAAFLSNLSQQSEAFSAALSAAFLSSLSQQSAAFSAAFLSSFFQLPSSAIILLWSGVLWSGVGGQLLPSSCCGPGLVVIFLWPSMNTFFQRTLWLRFREKVLNKMSLMCVDDLWYPTPLVHFLPSLALNPRLLQGVEVPFI